MGRTLMRKKDIYFLLPQKTQIARKRSGLMAKPGFLLFLAPRPSILAPVIQHQGHTLRNNKSFCELRVLRG